MATYQRSAGPGTGKSEWGVRGRQIPNFREGTPTIPWRRSLPSGRSNPGRRALDPAGALHREGTERTGTSPKTGDCLGDSGVGGGQAAGRGAGWGARDPRRGHPGLAHAGEDGSSPGEWAGRNTARARERTGRRSGLGQGQPSARSRLPGSAGPEHHRRRRLTQRPRPAVPGPTRRRRRRPRPDSPSAAPLAAPARAAPVTRPAAPPAVPEEAAPPAAGPQRPPPPGRRQRPPMAATGVRREG